MVCWAEPAWGATPNPFSANVSIEKYPKQADSSPPRGTEMLEGGLKRWLGEPVRGFEQLNAERDDECLLLGQAIGLSPGLGGFDGVGRHAGCLGLGRPACPLEPAIEVAGGNQRSQASTCGGQFGFEAHVRADVGDAAARSGECRITENGPSTFFAGRHDRVVEAGAGSVEVGACT